MFDSHNLPILSVTEISSALKKTLEDSFPFIRVRGEISGFKRATSGHIYLNLKDQDSVLAAVCWRGTASKISHSLTLEDGIEVIATGRITSYPARSNYQLVIEHIEMAGEGALLQLLEKRKKQLAAEGLFDEARKQPIPQFPSIIGVVTSPTGSVIRDILHRVTERFPCHVLVWPVLVQGEGAKEQIAAAIEGFNQLEQDLRPDIIIVARGGGSIEDLWAFNEEIVVRAAANSRLPLISAVGHETDTTLIDLASSRRAPTPTAAAEMAVPVRSELLAGIKEIESRLYRSSTRLLQSKKELVAAFARGLISPKVKLETIAQKLDDWTERLSNAIVQSLQRRKDRVNEVSSGLVSPQMRLSLMEQQLNEWNGRLNSGSASYLAKKTRPLELLTTRFSSEILSRMLQDKIQRLGSVASLLNAMDYRTVISRGYVLVRGVSGEIKKTKTSAMLENRLRLEFSDGILEVNT